MINIQAPYGSTFTKPNFIGERTHQPTSNIDNDAFKRSFIEQTLPKYVGREISNEEEPIINPEEQEEQEEEPIKNKDLESISIMDSMFQRQKILLKENLTKAGLNQHLSYQIWVNSTRQF